MKKKNSFKPRGSVIAALDIGSSKIACLIGKVIDDEGTIKVIGVGHRASKGIRSGSVIDLSAAESSIKEAVHSAEKMAADEMKGFHLRDIVVNVPGVHASSYRVDAEVQVKGQEVTESDINNALARAQSKVISPDTELIHTIPISYKIDSQEGVRDPLGMVGQNLEVGIHMVAGDLGPLQNIATCIEKSHLDIEALCHSSYAAGLSCLVEDEMDLGCTVIDMGMGVTSFAVFQGMSMIYCDAIAVGGGHITNDITNKEAFDCSIVDAERIKTLYGSAIATMGDDNELIEVMPLGSDNEHEPNRFTRTRLVGVIQPRLEEILDLVRKRLSESGLENQVGRRVVLTGGASQIPGLCDLTQVVLEKQARVGRPIGIAGLPDSVSGPEFATVAGLLLYVSEKSSEMPAEIMAAAEPGNLWEQVKLWLRENW
jgi:cell division protein FtsA